MHDPKAAWDRRYSAGSKWGGARQELPELPEGARVLEIGCGTGDNTIHAAESGWKVTAIDISSRGVEIASKRVNERKLEVKFLERDAALPLCDLGLFDCVLLHHVLGAMLMEERKKCAENALEVLHGTGTISFLDLSTDDMRCGMGEEVEEGTYLKKDGIIQHFFTAEEVRSLFSEMGSTEINCVNWTQKGGLNRSRISGLFHW